MAEQITTKFTYSQILRLLQEGCYDQAIAMLSRRVESQPLDRAARLMLLLANMSKFGPGEFKRQIDEIRLIGDLSGNERYIVQQIFLVGFRHAAQEGQTIQKIVYQCLLRRLMLGHPLNVSISATQEIDEERSNPSFAEDISHTLGVSEMNRAEAELEIAPVAPPRIRRWSQRAMIAAGTMIIIVLLGFYVATERNAPLAQQPSRLLAVVASGVQMETGADRNLSTVNLAPTFTAEPARRLIVGQLGELNKAYARRSDADPFTSGTVALKLSIEPSGKIAKVEEVVSRLSDHGFVDVVVAEVKQWKLPLGGTKTAEISVPLIFVSAKAEPAQLPAEGKSREPGVARKDRPPTHTSLVREQVEPPAPGLPTVAQNETRLQHHSRGRPARASDTGITPGAKGSDNSLENVAVKRKPAAASTIPESETEIAGTAALKHAPRFAAAVIEKVGPGTRVTVLRKERDWIKVKVKTSGNVGYLRKEYLAAFNTIH